MELEQLEENEFCKKTFIKCLDLCYQCNVTYIPDISAGKWFRRSSP